jgi:hypothetical protein
MQQTHTTGFQTKHRHKYMGFVLKDKSNEQKDQEDVASQKETGYLYSCVSKQQAWDLAAWAAFPSF